MSESQLIASLNAALAFAQDHDASSMEAILEDVREASYEVTSRQSAFLIRMACSAVEHVVSAFDVESSSQSAIWAIARAQEAAGPVTTDLTVVSAA